MIMEVLVTSLTIAVSSRPRKLRNPFITSSEPLGMPGAFLTARPKLHVYTYRPYLRHSIIIKTDQCSRPLPQIFYLLIYPTHDSACCRGWPCRPDSS